MLGIQESRTDGSLPARTYRCMACAATFPGLSSLLVHQTSHANDNTPDSLLSPAGSSQEACSTCGTTFANKELLNQHNCNAVNSSASGSVYICECGFDFEDINAMNEHRKSHGKNVQVKTSEVGATSASKISNSSQHCSTSSSASQSSNISSQSAPVLLVCPPFHQFNTKLSDAEVHEKEAKNVFPLSQSSELPSLPVCVKSQRLIQHTNPSSSNSLSSSELSVNKQKEVTPPKKTLKKLLVSAFMERLPPAQISWKPSKEHISTKTGMSAEFPTSLNSSVQQLRRLLNKSSKTKVAATNTVEILRSKQSTEKPANTVNLNETFLPIVALETRQKLSRVSKGAQEGRHQCGCCRRIFQHVDNLILHHTVHKKEKIFGCRRCKQLLISKASILLHHVCPPDCMTVKQPFSAGVILPSSLGRLTYSNSKASLESSSVKPVQKRPFLCHLCKHGFTRLYNLKKHQCRWFSHRSVGISQQKANENSSNKTPMKIQEAQTHKNVAVGTEAFGGKLEQNEEGPTLTVLENSQNKSSTWKGSPNSFMPFVSKTVVNNVPVADSNNTIKAETEDKEASNNPSAQQDDEQGQWTIPIDESDIDCLVEADNKEDLCLMETAEGQSSSPTQNSSLSAQVSSSTLANNPEAVKKRFACPHCEKSYVRRFTLNQHLKSCQKAVGTPMPQDATKAVSMKGNLLCEGKQRFECLQCGKTFSRRYNMVLHKKRYHSANTSEVASNSRSGTEAAKILPGEIQGTPVDHVSQRRMLIFPPPVEKQDSGIRHKNQATTGDWGIMSLPLVLPRKVTCECGSVFTCPRLLFEHLQMHAQESFICPQCGENFQSWHNYETHLHTHKRSVCSNCQQTFSNHSSLVRHLTKNRCKANFPKGNKFSCSHCGLELPDYPNLSLHMQNCQHSPSCKLIRCPICTRGFGHKDAVQRHLFTHSHPNAFRCLLCQRSYPSLQSLKDHRRKVHHIKLGTFPAVQAK